MSQEDEIRIHIGVETFKRDNFIERIEALHSEVVSITVESSPQQIAEFEVRSKMITSHYEDFEASQLQLVKSHLQLNEPLKIPELKKIGGEVDKLYYEILSFKEQFITKPTVDNVLPTNLPSRSIAKLPKINLPNFDGSIKEWPQFKDLFVALVHSNEILQPVEKFHFLISSTKGEVNQLVRSLPLCANNYDIVWNQLLERYDNQRLLANLYLEEILNLKSVTHESPKLLRHMLDMLSENTNALKSMSIPDELGNFIILSIALKKLDKHSRQLFERRFADTQFPKLDEFFTFFREHCKCLEAAQTCEASSSQRSDIHTNSRQFPMIKRSSPNVGTLPKTYLSTESRCLSCLQSHSIYKCPQFLNLSPSDRRNLIKSKEACFNCLSSSHMQNKCNSNHVCRKCSQRHHTFLHEDVNRTPNSKPYKSSQNEGETISLTKEQRPTSSVPNINALISSSPPNITTLLGTALVHVQDSSKHFQVVRVLIDPGSQNSFVTEACVRKLCLPRRKFHQSIMGLSQTPVTGAKGSVECVIKPRTDSGPLLQTTAIILTEITSPLPSMRLSSEVQNYFQDWNLADPNFYAPGPIECLLGADLFPHIFHGGRKETPSGFPTPFQTVFGWLLIGQTSMPYIPTHQSIVAHLAISDSYSLNENLKKFWELEEPPSIKRFSPEEDRCETYFNSTCSRDSNGRFIVSLPFKNELPNLGNSRARAYHCLLSQERRLENSTALKNAYLSFMDEYEELGHMTRLNSNDKLPTYYIPHHAVFKTNETTPKLRVVFNASASTQTGKSLNDELMIGPKLQNDICSILSRFRFHRFTVTTDIVKMYRQILVTPEHRQYQAILWRKNPALPVDTYLLNTVTYGVNSSPYLAIRTLQKLATEEAQKYPLAANAILNDMYVDDCLSGMDSLESCLKLKSQLISIFKSGGFELSKWSSNSPEILRDVSSQHEEKIFNPDRLEPHLVKVLGLKWIPISDTFTYDAPSKTTAPTKRGVLSHLSQIFDPLGLVSPVVFWAKHLMQQLWTLGLSWDDTLPEDLLSTWNRFCLDLYKLSKLLIPRFVLTEDFTDVQIHSFCDASEKGYACCVYLRTVDRSGLVVTHLVLAKSKVAPLKQISIPKLELCGAHLLSKVIKFYLVTLQITKLANIPVYAWTDSTVALGWIRTEPYRLKTFVGNRVTEIQEVVEPSQWSYVPTQDNPADCASRGLLPGEICNNHLWWHGPEWLLEDSAKWPSQDFLISKQDIASELRSTKVTCDDSSSMLAHHSTGESEDLLAKMSDFDRLKRITSWCRRFAHNCRVPKDLRIVTPLTVQELNASLNFWIKKEQENYFGPELKCLRSEKPCKTEFQRLNPMLDAVGIIRVGGRLHHSSLQYTAKHPVLLPKNSKLTKLLINHYHVKYFHAGPQVIQSLLQRNFWILSSRSAIRKEILRCVKCTQMKAQSPQPFMADLPAYRVNAYRPFLKVGIDFGGPFLIKTERSRKPQIRKAYLCLIICLATKALHLEVVSDLTTEAFLAAFNRFIARRGLCSDVYSDRGTNFIGAKNILNEFYRLTNSSEGTEKIVNSLSSKGITWHLNPPLAPHFGGIWEAGIKSAKSLLVRVTKGQALTFEELTTLFSQIEAILNSRPLCPLSSDVTETDVLTPGHFLIGEPLASIPQPDHLQPSLPLNRLSRWQLISQARHHFWKRWSNEYLHTLQQRSKWITHVPNVKIGDLAILKENNLPPCSWRIARVIEVFPSEDGVVRVVKVKTSDGEAVRPVVMLCLLPIDTDV